MKVWIVAGEYPTSAHPGHGTFVADQVAALRGAGHHVSVVESAAPSLRPIVNSSAPAVRSLISRVRGRRSDADVVAPLPGPSVSSSQGPDDAFGELQAAVEEVLASLETEGEPHHRGPAGRARALAAWGARTLVGTGRVTHDAAGNTVAVARMVAMMIGLMRSDGLPDVVHAHNVFPAGIAATQFGPARGVPVVVTEHISAYLRGQYAPIELAAAIRVLDRAAAVVAVSAVQAEALPIPTDRVTVVPNVVSGEDFRLRDERARQAGTVLSIGRLTANKRMDVVLRAYAALPAGLRAKHALRIVGSGPEREGLAELARELSLDDGVFVGPLSRAQVATEMAQTAVLVSASEVETFGVSLIEALAAGVPFVATDSGGPRDIVGPGLGRLVHQHDLPGLTAALAETLTDEQDEAADQARRDDAVARFGPQAVARALGELYIAAGAGRS